MYRLFQDILLAKGDGTYGKLASQLTQVDLLILDDWGLAPQEYEKLHGKVDGEQLIFSK